MDQVMDARQRRARQVPDPRPRLAGLPVEALLHEVDPRLLLVQVEVGGRAAPEHVHDPAGVGEGLVRPEAEVVRPEAPASGHAGGRRVGRGEVDAQAGRPHVVAGRRGIPDAQRDLRGGQREAAEEHDVRRPAESRRHRRISGGTRGAPGSRPAPARRGGCRAASSGCPGACTAARSPRGDSRRRTSPSGRRAGCRAPGRTRRAARWEAGGRCRRGTAPDSAPRTAIRATSRIAQRVVDLENGRQDRQHHRDPRPPGGRAEARPAPPAWAARPPEDRDRPPGR